jgi:hypothetical protein
MIPPAPVALFVYNRLELVKRTVEALKQNERASESDLKIFSDSWKREKDKSAVEHVRNFIGGISGFRSVTIVAREQNLGLSRSIISGVTSLLQNHDALIVLEDDLVTSPYFLRYMNDALRMYANEPTVVSVHGYVYPVSKRLPETFFLRGADCWGWGTWKRAWRTLRLEADILIEELRQGGRAREFDFDHSFPYTRMLRKQANDKIDSWAVCWYASAFLANMLTLYPGRSLVNHVGTAETATHAWSLSNRFDVPLADSPIRVQPIPPVEDPIARAAFQDFFKTSRGTIFARGLRALRRPFLRMS